MAIEDLIPLDVLYGKPQKKKKKIDKEAMGSSLMRIPRMKVEVVRDLIDLGIREIFELSGRAPETIFEEIQKLKPTTEQWKLPYIRMAVYFSEVNLPDPKKLHPQVWVDPSS
jgi:hypothetical protein